MDILEKASLMCLYAVAGIGSKTLQKAKERFGSFTEAWCSGPEGWPKEFSNRIDREDFKAKRQGKILHYYSEQLLNGLYNMVSLDEVDYPFRLRNIEQAPYVLFYQGRLDCLQGLSLAVVGARKASAYGRKTARLLSRQLAEEGAVIVSGLARGIDSEAHRGALDADGATVAVLGSGLDIVYPPENKRLLDSIRETGAVISEFLPGTGPEAGNFPRRNRIISGLSAGVIVVEARSRSGALITADFALEQGRDVFAIPGPVSSETSLGTNNLIKQGAKLVSSAFDILEEYMASPSEVSLTSQHESLVLDRNEEEILKYIGYEAIHFNDLLSLTRLDIGAASTALIKLELYGLIQSLPGKQYARF